MQSENCDMLENEDKAIFGKTKYFDALEEKCTEAHEMKLYLLKE